MWQVGDRVVALPDHRAWAELVPVPAKYVYQVPEPMPLQVRLWLGIFGFQFYFVTTSSMGDRTGKYLK